MTFETAMSGGELVEIYTQFNQLLLEDGDRIQLSTTESHIRSVTINCKELDTLNYLEDSRRLHLSRPC